MLESLVHQNIAAFNFGSESWWASVMVGSQYRLGSTSDERAQKVHQIMCGIN